MSSLRLPKMQSIPLPPATSRLTAPASGRAGGTGGLGGWNWTQLLMLALALWATLLYSGLGGGLVTRLDVAAYRLEARVLAQLRQGGASQTARWGRSEAGFNSAAKAGVTSHFEPGIKAPVQATAAASSPPPHASFAALLPLLADWLTPVEPKSQPVFQITEPSQAVPPWHRPLTRAPPPPATQALLA